MHDAFITFIEESLERRGDPLVFNYERWHEKFRQDPLLFSAMLQSMRMLPDGPGKKEFLEALRHGPSKNPDKENEAEIVLRSIINTLERHFEEKKKSATALDKLKANNGFGEAAERINTAIERFSNASVGQKVALTTGIIAAAAIAVWGFKKIFNSQKEDGMLWGALGLAGLGDRKSVV